MKAHSKHGSKDWRVKKVYWGTVLQSGQKTRRNMWKPIRKVSKTKETVIQEWTKKRSKRIAEPGSDKTKNFKSDIRN